MPKTAERPMRAKVFWTGRSQAVRLPKEYRFTSDTVMVRRSGNGITLTPADEWPPGYFEQFGKTFKDLKRPPQGRARKIPPLP